jgi:pimeloyl-ACP methyl ester carboxylesterase
MKRAFLFLLGFMACAAHAATKIGYVPVNGLQIYYEVHGTNQKGTPLVLLHGGGSTIETSFGPIVEELAKTRPVVAFEQQGHGHTADIAKRPFTFEGSANDTVALLKFLRIEQADFFGYSNGGSIAMLVASKNPALVRKLIVASAMTKRDGMVPGFWDGFAHASLDNMPAELKEAYMKVAPSPKNLQSFHDKCVERMVNFKDWPDDVLKSIQAPTLILIGDHDIVRPEHAVEMFRLLTKGQLLIVPGADHMTLVKNWPVEFILKFLD